MTQDEKTAKATLVQTKYTEMLLQIPHVMGVAIGLQQKNGEYTGEVCLVVMVDKKMPADQLDPQSIIPSELDGVAVDVQEIGVPTAY
ncbi:MAG: hypothetical protein R3E39_11410 [Anaerolineae bacterium]